MNRYCIAVVLQIALLALTACDGLQTNSRPTLPPTQAGNATQPATSSKTTATGFYWPTGTDEPGDYAEFLAGGCSGKLGCFTGDYHLGYDIAANYDPEVDVGDPVYAIAVGIVTDISDNG